MKTTQEGLVIKSVGGLFEVCPDGDAGARIPCRGRGSLRRGDARVLVGDRVVLAEEGSTAVIEQVLPRKNALIRPPLANLGALFVTLAVTSPAPLPETTDKLLAIAEHNAIPAAVIVTKSDLAPAAAQDLVALYRGAGYPAFAVSRVTGEGVPALSDYLRGVLRGGCIGAFSGASGVGKSSLINTLFPACAAAEGAISERIGRGKNTTRHTELFPVFDGGYLADTPGFSMLDFARFDFMERDDLAAAFREFAPYLSACRYTDCRHIKEEECAVRAAVRDGKISKSRYRSYCTLYAVLDGKAPYAGK